MRKIIENQLKIGQVDISKIELDLRSRDEIPQLLLGLQAIYKDRSTRQRVFEILEKIVPDDIDAGNGRPGMDLWSILVLGTLRLNCNWDYDKLLEIANNHKTVREFLGHTIYEFGEQYALQTLKDNVSLFTPEHIDQINQVVVKAGYKMLGYDKDSIKGRCDSFVVETNVHYPTDINLLWDAIRKVITLIAMECFILGITEWRQSDYILCKIKKAFNLVRRLKRSNAKSEERKAKKEERIVQAHLQYVDLVGSYVERAKFCIGFLKQAGMGNVGQIVMIENFIMHAERQIDQIIRRVVKGEKIPHSEKVFSVFEEHTEWISKGKAGVPQELGLKVCVLEDQYGFILHHHVMVDQTDDQIAVAMVADTQEKYNGLIRCSFDKGFHSPQNQKDLKPLLDQVVLPRKGRLSEKAKQIENSEDFVHARRQHAAVESAINALENHGLDRCPDHGLHGFKRYVGLAVLSRNIQKLGAALQEQTIKRIKRRKKAAERSFRLAA
ncbi:DDE transposase [Desulfosarcina ovata subsp. sediminis]|uniref:DDE transposase n=1 Tax=Desulfosarcina ovata subsp. sediminis TaxID=885957 RepID=A0A5K7ZTF2_9BACT|nr:ISNCY family transposase [Desulfosarcina ovata]BBO81308.1 DDE transposase [Desulfosarcina ovata subsp. sediminis]BBO82546.1 DDE transposase [Desulfosarcina ovata subsp. sediminis]BBO83474.1 DDE transposase [Desulfosarcina ovata subsp. sediminis]